MNKRKKFFVAISLLMVSVLLLSTGVYAWFSMSRNVKASGMGMDAAGTSALMLSQSGVDGTFSDDLDYVTGTIVKLLPASSINGEEDSFYYAQAKGIWDTGAITTNKTSIYKYDGSFSEYDADVLAKNGLTGAKAYVDYTLYLKASARNDQDESIYAKLNLKYNGVGTGYADAFRYTMFIEEAYVALDLHTVLADECDEATDKYTGFAEGDIVIDDAGTLKTFDKYLVDHDVKSKDDKDEDVQTTYANLLLYDNDTYNRLTADEANSKIYGINFAEGDVIVKNTAHTLTALGVDSNGGFTNKAYTDSSNICYAVETVTTHTVTATDITDNSAVYGSFVEGNTVVVVGAKAFLLDNYLSDNEIKTLVNGDVYYTDDGEKHEVTELTYVKKTGKILYYEDTMTTYNAANKIAVIEDKETRVIPVTIRVWLDGGDANTNSVNFVTVDKDYTLSVEFSIDPFN